MVPISRGKQVAGAVALIACGYVISWAFTPGPGTGPVDSFAPTFGGVAAPVVIVAPDRVRPDPNRSSEPANSPSQPLQKDRTEPI